MSRFCRIFGGSLRESEKESPSGTIYVPAGWQVVKPTAQRSAALALQERARS
jgi:hypothetical protein